jgi:hypothetical protein
MVLNVVSDSCIWKVRTGERTWILGQSTFIGAAAGTPATNFLTEMDDIDAVDNVLGDAGGVDFEPEVVEESASDEEGIMIGPWVYWCGLFVLLRTRTRRASCEGYGVCKRVFVAALESKNEMMVRLGAAEVPLLF